MKAALLHSSVVLLLISVSVWDSVQIIHTYIYDNRLTVVRTEVTNDSAPFLDNLTLYVTFGDSVLPKALLREKNITSVRTSKYYTYAEKAIQNGELSIDSINVSTLEGMITALYILSELATRDVAGYQCLEFDREPCKALAASRNFTTFQDGQKLEKLEDQFFSALSEYYFRLFRVHSITIHAIFWLHTLAVDVHPRAVSRLSYHYEHSFAMRLLEDSSSDFSMDNESQPIVNIYVKETLVQVIEFDPKRQYQIVISVKNLGIFDKSATTACTREPDIMTSNGASEEYNDRDYLKRIVRKCGCVPFIEKKHFRVLDEYSPIANIPYCDYQHYFDCNINGGPDVELLPSCVVIRNEYSVLSTISPFQCEQAACSFVNFTILSSDQSYVVFEDRVQLTFTQFLSQLGGDIGLYTGLSVLSIWQLIVLVHERYKRYKSGGGQHDVREGQKHNCKGFVREFFKRRYQQSIDYSDGNDRTVMMEILEEQATMRNRMDQVESNLNEILAHIRNSPTVADAVGVKNTLDRDIEVSEL